MITLKDFMETVDYRITEGSDYGWSCYGSNAYCLDSWNGDFDGHTLSVTFDTKTQQVYEAYVCDYKNKRAYRIINPDYKQAHDDEVKAHEIDDCAWDDIKFIDLETDTDFLDKASAIIAGIDYDTRVSIPLDIPEDELLVIFKAAHERDMTFNQFVEEALKTALEDFERDPESFKKKYTRK